MSIFKNYFTIFHPFIIASLLLSISGCGYKGSPYYEEVPVSDDNVKFILKKRTFDKDNNESCREQ